MKYRFADIVIDSSSHCVMRRAQVVRVTNIEFRLLEYLTQNADHICSREDILNHVWGQQFQYDTGTIDVHLHSIRRKLGFDNQYPIESIRNVGIILRTKPKQQPHTLIIQEFAIQWITDHKTDFQVKQLTPLLRLDPFVSEITISAQDLRQMLDGILQVLLPVSHPGVIRIKSHLGRHHFSLSLDVNGTVNELRIPLA